MELLHLPNAINQVQHHIKQLKDRQLKEQLSHYVDHAVAQLKLKDNVWAKKSYSGAPVSYDEPSLYQLIINEIPYANSDLYGKKLQIEIGVHGDEVFHFGYMLQGVSADRSKKLNDLKNLKNLSALEQFRYRKQIKDLEDELFSDPSKYAFTGEIADITFAKQGGLAATINTFERTNDKTDGNERRKWLEFDENQNAKDQYAPVTTSKIKQIVTDENYNNIIVQKSVTTEGNSIVGTTHTKKIELKENLTLSYTEEITKFVSDENKTIKKINKTGELPKNTTAQLNLEMAKYCTKEGSKGLLQYLE